MKHYLFFTRTLFVASMVLVPLILPVVSPAAESKEGPNAISEEQAQGLEQIATDSVEDTLKACLARIPKDASAGQRLLAEQSCRQVEEERKETQLTF